jgi:cell division protein FtsN
MPRDYKHRVEKNRRRRQPRTGLRWLLAIVLIGSFGVFLLALSSDERNTRESVPGVRAGNGSAAPPKEAAGPVATGKVKGEIAQKKLGVERQEAGEKQPPLRSVKPPEPRFTFYKILPEKEIILPEKEIRTIKREERRGKVPAGGGYMLQAGAYRKAQDAEKLRAQLASLGIDAKIEKVRVENLDWLRIKIGPFATVASADKIRARLRRNHIDSVVQKAAPK